MDQEITTHQYSTRSKSVRIKTQQSLPIKKFKVKIIDHHDEDNLNIENLYNKKASKKVGKKVKKSKNTRENTKNTRVKKIKKVYGYLDGKNKLKNTSVKGKRKTRDKKTLTPPLKVVELNTSKPIIKKKRETVKININPDATKLLTNMILEKAFGAFQNKNIMDSEYDSDSDPDYEPIDGLPENIDYMEEETKYLKKLNKTERSKIFDTERQILEFNSNTIPTRFKILQSNLNISSKNIILKKLDHYYSLEETENEYSKLTQWVEGLEKIPLGQNYEMNVNLDNHTNEIVGYFNNVKNILDKSVFGHEIAKSKIIQILAQNITNPQCLGNCIAIQGPPGNGKTTLVKDGICKALGRPFGFVPLGGMQNSDFMVGHDYTYEGGKPGRIVEILQETQCMNPVIYFDELDKISDTPKGEEIAGVLCHLTDPSQNSEFHDKYFSGIDFDISKAIFIFSYNDESKVNKILLDRMTKIHTKGFGTNEKLQISKNYLIPRMCKDVGFNEKDIIFPDEIIKSIITNKTLDEKGVRNLKRCFETIISKLNVIKLLNGYSNFNTDIDRENDLKILNQNNELFENMYEQKDEKLEQLNNNSDNNSKEKLKEVKATEKKNDKKISLDISKKEKVKEEKEMKKGKKKKNDKKMNKDESSKDSCYFCKDKHSSNDCPTIKGGENEDFIRDYVENLVELVATKVEREKKRKPISKKEKKDLIKYHIPECSFPITITDKLVNKLLEKNSSQNINLQMLYI